MNDIAELNPYQYGGRQNLPNKFLEDFYAKFLLLKTKNVSYEKFFYISLLLKFKISSQSNNWSSAV